ncbi:hypothetical protein MAGR_30020 [Mycolicibacterium agri]|uniref:Uncharacterized protein n=1 Tax=Mycolicibacterium agri TaxID=36811 RepID=A0A7I9W1H9_MYCAG|nr:hypothetical protein MAGR_30020 [Mycolicibacterium agri]
MPDGSKEPLTENRRASHTVHRTVPPQLMTPEEFAALGVAFAKIKATVDEADAEEAAAAQ